MELYPFFVNVRYFVLVIRITLELSPLLQIDMYSPSADVLALTFQYSMNLERKFMSLAVVGEEVLRYLQTVRYTHQNS